MNKICYTYLLAIATSMSSFSGGMILDNPIQDGCLSNIYENNIPAYDGITTLLTPVEWFELWFKPVCSNPNPNTDPYYD